LGKYFLGTQNTFWDQWSHGPILFPSLTIAYTNTYSWLRDYFFWWMWTSK
jgi:hypothetical protein